LDARVAGAEPFEADHFTNRLFNAPTLIDGGVEKALLVIDDWTQIPRFQVLSSQFPSSRFRGSQLTDALRSARLAHGCQW
jgi:hypothetical protein